MRTFALGILVLLGPVGLPAAAASTLPGAAGGEDSACQVSVGQPISPVSIDTLISMLGASLEPRGEFESTSHYQARLAAAGAGAPAHAYVTMPLDPKYITYDADAGKFRIESYALDNKNASWDVFYDGPNPPWPRPVGLRNYVDLVERSIETVRGTYDAGNAYGAQVTVRRVSRETVGVLDRTATGREDLFFGDRPWVASQSNVIAEVAVDPAAASRWREGLKAAALVVPKSPYVVQGTKDWGRPRLDLPKETTEQLTAVIADIKCMVVTDRSDVVLVNIPTR